APYCKRIEIAGSIRRGKPEVGDIEIVALPDGNFEVLDIEIVLPGLLPGADFIKNGSRYKQIALPDGINLDLFLVRPPAEWGVIFLLRTGPADFSRKAVTPKSKGGLLPSNCRVRDGQVWRNDIDIPMDEEEDFLKLIGLSGLAPEKRKAAA
ncbi:MAG: hypothetical protein IMZ62_05710, partial [Chloroflexi bacterium]|nr:hypothetical protein [Chloroflexota bacterium]